MNTKDQLSELSKQKSQHEQAVSLLEDQIHIILKPLFAEQNDVASRVLKEFPDVNRWDHSCPSKNFFSGGYCYEYSVSEDGSALAHHQYNDGEYASSIKLLDVFLSGGSVEEKEAAVRQVFLDAFAEKEKEEKARRQRKIDEAKKILYDAGVTI